MKLSCEEVMCVLFALENVSVKLKPHKRGVHEIYQLRKLHGE